MIGSSRCISSVAPSGTAAGSSGCMWPSLRISGSDSTHRWRSDAPAAFIAWKRRSIGWPSLIVGYLVDLDDVRHVDDQRRLVGFDVAENLRVACPIAEAVPSFGHVDA